MITDYHAGYSHELSRIDSTFVYRLGHALFDACIDLKSHQIEAGLVLYQSRAKTILANQ